MSSCAEATERAQQSCCRFQKAVEQVHQNMQLAAIHENYFTACIFLSLDVSHELEPVRVSFEGWNVNVAPT